MRMLRRSAPFMLFADINMHSATFTRAVTYFMLGYPLCLKPVRGSGWLRDGIEEGRRHYRLAIISEPPMGVG